MDFRNDDYVLQSRAEWGATALSGKYPSMKSIKPGRLWVYALGCVALASCSERDAGEGGLLVLMHFLRRPMRSSVAVPDAALI